MEYSGHSGHFKTDRLSLYNMDCMELLRQTPDKHYSLCIVAPPYGMDRKMDGTGGAGRIMRKWKRQSDSIWDTKPNQEYFDELMRVSRNQIIWGANNFIENLRSTTNFIFWFKHQPASNFADGELAWTSFLGTCRCFDHACFGAHGQDEGGKIHPTQKPVALYKWLLHNYAKQGDKILDTHLGSGSIAIACHQMGYDLTGSELDKDYFEAMQKRIKLETAQRDLFI